MPSYLLAIVAGDVPTTDDPAGTHAKHETYLGVPYPWSSLRIVGIDGFDEGMENVGLITVPANDLHNQYIIDHELAHQWAGDLVTPASWSEVWLAEGLATFLGEDVVMGGGLSREDGFAEDSFATAWPLVGPGPTLDVWDGIPYGKGAAVLQMISHEIGTEKMRAGLRGFLTAHANGNVTTADLEAALSDAAGEDLRPIIDSFATQPGFPLVSIAVDCAHEPRAIVTQEPYRLIGEPPRTGAWRVPVCVHTATEKRCAVAGPGETTIPLASCPDWLYPDADGAGFYRFTLSPGAEDALTQHLTGLGIDEQFDLAADLTALLRAGRLPVERWVAGMEALGKLDALHRDVAVLVDGVIEDLAPDAQRAALERSLVKEQVDLGGYVTGIDLGPGSQRRVRLAIHARDPDQFAPLLATVSPEDLPYLTSTVDPGHFASLMDAAARLRGNVMKHVVSAAMLRTSARRLLYAWARDPAHMKELRAALRVVDVVLLQWAPYACDDPGTHEFFAALGEGTPGLPHRLAEVDEAVAVCRTLRDQLQAYASSASVSK
jgi:hypothetical protein